MTEPLDEEIRENYRKLAPEKLMEIARNVEDDYTRRAVELAKEELRTRGVGEIPPPPEPEAAPEPPPEEAEEPEEPDLARSRVIREYGDELEAGTALGWLAAENIRAFIWQDDCGGQRPHLRARTGIRLVVLEDDLAAAEEILREFESDPEG